MLINAGGYTHYSYSISDALAILPCSALGTQTYQ
ncbi:type II 3-dehydroquinate dehydratase [Caballeronia catudaia]